VITVPLEAAADAYEYLLSGAGKSVQAMRCGEPPRGESVIFTRELPRARGDCIIIH
jgi:hypothetical protein